MNGDSVYEPDPRLAGRKIRLRSLDRTMKALTGLFEAFFFSESYAREKGILQELDARVKLLSFLLLVIVVSLLHSIPLIYGVYVLTLILAFASKIKTAYFMGRIWLTISLFIGMIALPATLNVFTPGETVIHLYSLGQAHQIGPYYIPAEIAISRQGLSTALLLIGRVATSMALVLLLTLTTPWTDLLKALRSVRIPRIYVQTLSMTLRYLLLLCQIVRETHIAKKSRTIRAGRTPAEQKWVAGQVGTLFKRSMQLSAEVHRAMVARGFQGDVLLLSVFRIRRRDYAWMALCIGISGLLLYWN